MSYTDYYVLSATLQVARELPAGDPPANYKDPVKIAAWKTEQASKLARKAALTPGFGALASYCVLNAQGREVKAAQPAEEYRAEPAIGLLSWILRTWPAETFTRQSFQPPGDWSCLVGFDVDAILAVAAFEVVQKQFTVPIGLWRPARFCADWTLDPAAYLTGLFPHDEALRQVLGEVPSERGNTFTAACAQKLVRQYQLLGELTPSQQPLFRVFEEVAATV